MGETTSTNSKASRAPLWLVALLNGLVTLALIVLIWALALGATGTTSHELTSNPYKIAIIALAGVVTVLITLWAFGSELRGKWDELSKSTVEIAPTLLRPFLFLLLLFILGMSYLVMVNVSFQIGGSTEQTTKPLTVSLDFFSLGLIGLAALPSLLTACASLLIERRMARGVFSFAIDKERLPAHLKQSQLPEQLQQNWDYERDLMQGSIQRMGRHGAILGFLASTIVATCAVTIVRNTHTLHELVALSVGTAASISFTLHLGQIFFRSASNDATARMMAWASRALLIVSVCALFFSALWLGSNERERPSAANQPASSEATPSAPPAAPRQQEPEQNTSPLQGRTGALLIGVAVALLGERLMRAMTNRAASLLGVEGLAAPQTGNLSLIDGLAEEDALRLAEERIDSVHALAFTPTPRIFFNTVYSLQRICDWQDQALLIERVGRTNALLLREQFFIRGAMAARRNALQKFAPRRREKAPEKAPEPTSPGGIPPSPPPAPQAGQPPPEAPPPTPPAGQVPPPQAPAPTPPAAQAPPAPQPQASPPAPPRDAQAPQLPPAPPPPSPEAQGEEEPEPPTGTLDISQGSHLHHALCSLIDDEAIERLEVFWRAVPIIKPEEPKLKPAPS